MRERDRDQSSAHHPFRGAPVALGPWSVIMRSRPATEVCRAASARAIAGRSNTRIATPRMPRHYGRHPPITTIVDALSPRHRAAHQVREAALALAEHRIEL